MGCRLGSCVTDSDGVSTPTAIITTNAFCTRPRGKGSPTSSTLTNWCWLITLSSMWGWLGVRYPRAPHQCRQVAATSASLLQRPPRCCPPPRTPAHHRPARRPHPPSSQLWWPDAWAEAPSVTVATARQSWRSRWERTLGPDHQALRSWEPSEGPHWPACPTTLVSSVSTPGPGVALSPSAPSLCHLWPVLAPCYPLSSPQRCP